MPVKIERIREPRGLPKALGEYSHAVRVRGGDLLFIDGQVPLDASGKLVGPGDFKAQFRQVMQSLGMLLEAVGGGYRNLVALTTYIVRQENYPAYREIRTELWPQLFPDYDYPTNTVVVLQSFYNDTFLVEVEGIAAL
jgi:enamine deaminase RidA (YjgF/YER057c/UK114 family)